MLFISLSLHVIGAFFLSFPEQVYFAETLQYL
jgi:hypothetical protein